MGYEQPTESPSDPEPEIAAVIPPLPAPVPRYLPAPAPLKPAGSQPSDVDSALAKGRHEIRRLRTQLEEQTKIAGKMEADRRERIKKLHEKVFIVFEAHCVISYCSNLFKVCGGFDVVSLVLTC